MVTSYFNGNLAQPNAWCLVTNVRLLRGEFWADNNHHGGQLGKWWLNCDLYGKTGGTTNDTDKQIFFSLDLEYNGNS